MKKYPKHLANIRQCPCIICGAEAEAAHLRMSSAEHNKTNGRNDMWVTPLCPWHHRLAPDCQHSTGEYRWWKRQGVDPLAIAKALWEAKDLLDMLQICLTAINTRHSAREFRLNKGTQAGEKSLENYMRREFRRG